MGRHPHRGTPQVVALNGSQNGRRVTRLTVLMGAPGAGKTTWAKANAPDAYVASSELVRTRRDLDVAQVMEFMRRAGRQQLAAGHDVIADATSTYPAHRRYWLAVAREAGAQAHLVAFDTALPLLVAAQRTRQHPAPLHVVRKHAALMRVALKVAPLEGWDDYQVIRRGYGGARGGGS
jgi:predicted kinase